MMITISLLEKLGRSERKYEQRRNTLNAFINFPFLVTCVHNQFGLLEIKTIQYASL